MWPIASEEALLDLALLFELDAIADRLEVARLQQMDVLVERIVWQMEPRWVVILLPSLCGHGVENRKAKMNSGIDVRGW